MKRKQVAVIGLGRLGTSLAITLHNLGHEVLALDTDEKNVQGIASLVTHAVQADATDEAVLKQLGIGNLDVAVVTASAVDSSVLSTILLKKLGVRYVIARADSDLHGEILRRIGADRVVNPESEMGTMLAHVLSLADAIDYIPVVPGYGVLKLPAPSYAVGETLAGLGFGSKGKWQVAVLVLQRAKGVLVTPDHTETVKAGDILVVAGNVDNIEDLLSEARKNRSQEA